MALGARRGAVVGLTLRQTMWMSAVGVVVGLGAAAAGSRYVEAMLFGISALDLVTFVAAPLILAAIAGLAAFVPARRAASVDPMVALRCE
jgi:ABC-type antimicrobial peptide transport system permease subunit